MPQIFTDFDIAHAQDLLSVGKFVNVRCILRSLGHPQISSI